MCGKDLSEYPNLTIFLNLFEHQLVVDSQITSLDNLSTIKSAASNKPLAERSP